MRLVIDRRMAFDRRVRCQPCFESRLAPAVGTAARCYGSRPDDTTRTRGEQPANADDVTAFAVAERNHHAEPGNRPQQGQKPVTAGHVVPVVECGVCSTPSTSSKRTRVGACAGAAAEFGVSMPGVAPRDQAGSLLRCKRAFVVPKWPVGAPASTPYASTARGAAIREFCPNRRQRNSGPCPKSKTGRGFAGFLGQLSINTQIFNAGASAKVASSPFPTVRRRLAVCTESVIDSRGACAA